MGSLLDKFSRRKPEVQPVEQVELVDEILSQPLTRESCDKLAQHGIFLVCSPKDIDLSDVPEEQEFSPYDDPPDIPISEDMDLSDSSDEEEVSPYTENDDAEDDEDDADNATRSEETAAFARDAADFLKERGASRELINWFFEAVGPGQFREALEVAERLYGLFGNDAEAAENYGRGLLPCQECGEGGVPWFVAKRLLRSVGLESANPFTTREEARRGWRILHGAKAALMHQLVQPTPDLPDNVGYIVGPEDEDPEA